jgi:hypothetical protein
MSAPHYDPYPRHYGPPQRWQTPPPPPVEPPPNFAAIISVVPGVLGLLLPAVFGPVALIAGFVSQYQALRAARRLLWVAVLGIVLGTFWTPGALVMLSR